MKVLTRVVLLCLAGIQLVKSQMIDLSTGTATVTEGTDANINVICTLNPATALTRDASCGLGIMTGVADSAENGYDVADLTSYTCTIPAGATTGNVDVPLTDDFAIDNNEMLTVTCATPSAGDTAGTTVTFTIMDGGTNVDAMLMIVPRLTFYKVSEAVTPLNILVDVYDSNGNRAPNEDDIDIQLVFPTASTTDTADGAADYDGAITAATIAGSVDGVGTSSFTIALTVTDDTILENLETFNILLSDSTTVASVTSDATTTITVQLQDNDKPELVILNPYPRLPRRSKADVVLKTFNFMQTWGTFDLTWLPFNLKDCYARDVTTPNGITVTETTLARPKYRSRGRFNEYKYTTSQTINAMTYELDAYAYVSTTSHSNPRAPIESWNGPTMNIWPRTVDAGTGACTSIANTIITVPRSRLTRQMRWWFIPDGGTLADLRSLKYFKGKNWVPISECGHAGLYIPTRIRRGNLGWVDFIRVKIAECPEGFTGAPACTTPATVCYHGGVFDSNLGLCACPPGFAGTNCEIATELGAFGSSCQFSISDIITGKRDGKCIQFSSPCPLGNRCYAGYYGEDCCKPCPSGKFGSNCDQTCHCIDDHCDRRTGECANGCATSFTGSSCQFGGP